MTIFKQHIKQSLAANYFQMAKIGMDVVNCPSANTNLLTVHCGQGLEMQKMTTKSLIVGAGMLLAASPAFATTIDNIQRPDGR